MTDAVIVDMDGTLCDVRSIRHLVERPNRDFNAFHSAALDCPPNQQAVDFCVRNHRAGSTVVIVSARMYQWEGGTVEWLGRHLPVPYTGPFMRGDDDYRQDVEVKRDIYHILTGDYGYRIVAACDDNPAIVTLWESLGIPTEIIHGWV